MVSAGWRPIDCSVAVHPSGCLSARSVVWERCIIIRTFVIKWKITKAAVNYLPQVLGKVEKTLHGLGHLVLDAYFHMVYLHIVNICSHAVAYMPGIHERPALFQSLDGDEEANQPTDRRVYKKR